MAKKPQHDQQQEAQQPDEFAGQGGSYILDPLTGKRVLVHRTKDPLPEADQSKGD